MKSIVVAMDKDRGIGANNTLLWQRDLPADLAHFKQLTVGKSIIMGRKTYESIGRALPDRENIVVSRSQAIADPGVVTAVSLVQAYALAQHPIAVIGGGQIYEQALSTVDVLYVTEVDAVFREASVFFPKISPDMWRETAREHHAADDRNKYAYDFVTYERSDA
jgi:dihydrofolate reductase